MIKKEDIIKISDNLYEIPKGFIKAMRVPARFYANDKLLPGIVEDRSLDQLVNVATLPGVQKYALAMPDIHMGYGFPIGGVAAMDLEHGVVSPGGVGYDINCGVRLLKSDLSFSEIKTYIENLTGEIQRNVPSGVGSRGNLNLKERELDKVLEEGVSWAVQKGYASDEDRENTEDLGGREDAVAAYVSSRAKKRGRDQLGTLGSGNHFLEIQRVDEIFDEEVASAWGIFPDQITIMIHSGSRGLGHQVCTDYVKELMKVMESKYQIKIPDRELACVPIKSEEGKRYLGAMNAAVNFAFVNRQVMQHLVDESWRNTLAGKFKNLDLNLLYDVAHNIAKIEDHVVDGKTRKLCVHRKGATRSFGPGRKELPRHYQETGQPVLIPGSMGTASYISVGTTKAMSDTWGSVCHGAGRVMSRGEAKRRVLTKNVSLKKELLEQGVIVRCASAMGLAEEATLAYKDISDIVDVAQNAGLARKVARLRPLGVVKGG